ncbi:MAG: hypothetical protein HUU06_08455 [Planctomycetaceae bacterium]|nr:hypothetical protein [Planctomycetaceae bacterium]
MEHPPPPHRLGLRAWTAWGLMALVLAAGAQLLTYPLRGDQREEEIAAAKAWVEALAREIRRVEREKGRLPEGIEDLLAEWEPPPPAAAQLGSPKFEVYDGFFSLSFFQPNGLMGYEAWTLHSGAGGGEMNWRHYSN